MNRRNLSLTDKSRTWGRDPTISGGPKISCRGYTTRFKFGRYSLADPRGGPGTPPGSKFFHFHAGKSNRLVHPLWELAAPSGKSWIRHWVLLMDAGFPRATLCIFASISRKFYKERCTLRLRNPGFPTS